MKLSHKNLPVLSQANDPILPLYYSFTKDSELNLNVKDLAANTDLCFDLRYQISNDSKLGISYESLAALSLTSTQTTDDTINWFPSKVKAATFCSSELTKTIGNEFKINFNADVNDPDNDIVILSLNNEKAVKQDDSLKSELAYLTHWSQTGADKDYVVNNQWPIKFPESFWSVPDPKKDIIKFSCELA